MKTTHQFVVMAAAVVVVVGLVVGLAYIAPGTTPTGPVAAGPSWGEENDYGVGLPNAIVLGPTTSPAGYSVVYVQGNISALSWHRYVGGAGNDTGSCSAPTPEPGVCDVYVGVWTPTGWSTYASGGLATPLWCYSTGSSGCTNASTFSFTSSNLVPSGESEWEVVIWNVSPWGLFGFINATEYYGPVSAAP